MTYSYSDTLYSSTVSFHVSDESVMFAVSEVKKTKNGKRIISSRALLSHENTQYLIEKMQEKINEAKNTNHE